MTITPQAPAPEWLHSYLKPSLVQSPPYTIDAVKVALKLDQNESPFDWPQDFKKSVTEKLLASEWNRYPPAYHRGLESQLARYVGVSDDAILLSPGSNHLIAQLLSLFNQNRTGKLVLAQPSFALYEQWSQFFGVPYELWPLDANLQYDLKRLPDLPAGSVLVFASPNNPVGNVLSVAQLETLLAANPNSYIIADEAYYEFAPAPFTPLLAKYANLILVRTFSKTMGAAGVRLGYCLASSRVIEQLRKLMLPYLLNHFTLIAAGEALSTPAVLAELKRNISYIIAERDRLYTTLTSAPTKFTVIPSHANFLLLRWPNQELCQLAYEGLIRQGILLRNVSKGPGLAGCLRLSVGSQQENDRVAAVLSKL